MFIPFLIDIRISETFKNQRRKITVLYELSIFKNHYNIITLQKYCNSFSSCHISITVTDFSQTYFGYPFTFNFVVPSYFLISLK